MKRKVLMISVIILVMSMLCACGDDAGSPGPEPVPQPTATENESTPAEPETVTEEAAEEPVEESAKDTVKQINAGALKNFSYYPAYDSSDGSSHSICLKKKNGKWVIDCYDKEGDNDGKDEYYEVSEEDLAEFEEFVKDERFSALGWRDKSGECPEGYNEWMYSMSFANPYSELGDDVNVYFNELREYTDEDRELIEELGRRFEALRGNAVADGTQNDQSETKGEYMHLFDTPEDVLYAYKEAQDGGYTVEQINELLGYHEALPDFGWPDEDSGKDVGYVYYDINSDGEDELIITYNDRIADIYGHYCGKMNRFYSGGPDVTATLYPDGILKTEHGSDPKTQAVLWSAYDEGFGTFCTTIRKEVYETGDSYSTTSYYGLDDELHKEIEEDLKNGGRMPVWMDELEDELTKAEYEKLIPKTKPVKLPEPSKLSDVVLPDGYKPATEWTE